jgi:hypothetical protein
VAGSFSIPKLGDQSYLCHVGNQPGVACAFELDNPPRTKIVPYSYLLCVDLSGDRVITLRYSFTDIEIFMAKNFPAPNQFIEDLANFRVSVVRESRLIKMRIISEPYTEKPEVF